jgi:hypothetical protein
LSAAQREGTINAQKLQNPQLHGDYVMEKIVGTNTTNTNPGSSNMTEKITMPTNMTGMDNSTKGTK